MVVVDIWCARPLRGAGSATQKKCRPTLGESFGVRLCFDFGQKTESVNTQTTWTQSSIDEVRSSPTTMSDVGNQVSKRKRKAQESWTKKADKKAKVVDPDAEDVPINPLVGEIKVPKKRKVPTKTTAVGPDGKVVTTEGGGGGGEGEEEPQKAVKNKRFILFIGNLSFRTTVEDVQAHIEPTGVVPTAVRLQTDPVTKKPKGFAFVDLPDFMSLDKVLNLHHTSLGGRKINVELTAGGGGSGESRRAKIAKKNEKLEVERETAQKTRRDAEAKKARAGGKDERRVTTTGRGGGGGGAEEVEKAKRQSEMADVNPARRRRIK